MRSPIAFSRTRRRLLQGIGAGLVIGVWLPRTGRAEASGAAAVLAKTREGAEVFAPNAFVRVAPDDTVTVLVKHIEFGQGPYTGLATLVAEEMDADWSQMRASAAPADVALYANLAFGIQGTGGSTAMANSYDQMRKAGAAARAMLVAAAAAEWGVEPAEITVEKGVLRHTAGDRSATFGDLAEKAATMVAPAEPTLKDPADFKLIGTALPKLDTVAKTTGEAQFTIDLYRDGMLTAVVAHPPSFGAAVAGVDDAAARAVPGVAEVKTIPQGVAVFAAGTHAALRGRSALQITWDETAAEKRSSEELYAAYRDAVAAPGAVAASRGDAAAAMAGAAKKLEAVYEFPFLAHAPMETLDAVLELKDGALEAWMGSQLQTVDRATLAAVMGMTEDKVTLHTMMAGGSFGRRAQPNSDFAAEAAAVMKALGRDGAVKLIWTREDDIRGGRYRPLTVHRLQGGIDADGHIIAWDNTIASQSIVAGSAWEEKMVQNGVDAMAMEGARDLPYAIADFRVSGHIMQCGVPALWWRSVGHTHTGFATETFIDELLELAGKDAVEGRLALLAQAPRHRAVLERAAQIANWGQPVAEGRARGVAVHKSFNSYVAQIVEISRGGDDLPRVHKVWCAVDCGVAVNPNVIAAQMEGGIGYGLGAALYDAITVEAGGTVKESNFDGYRSLRMAEMPAVEVAIVPSAEPPTGVGEPGVPPIAPAVANAWRRLTGKPVRRLPFAQAGVAAS